MDIAIVCERFGTTTDDALDPSTPSGERLLFESLAASGHRVTVYTLCGGAPARGVTGASDVPTVSIRPSRWRRRGRDGDTTARHAAGVLDHHWSKRRPDIVHVYGDRALRAASRTARRLRIPLLLGRACADGLAQTAPLNVGDLEHCDSVAVPWSDEAFALVVGGLPESAVRVVPPGVSTSAFTPEGPRRAMSPRPHLMWMCEGDNLGTATDAARLAAALPEAQVTIADVSTTPRLSLDSGVRQLGRHIARLGCDDRVRALACQGPRQRSALLRSADVVLCAGGGDRTAVATLESMACGVPVVATATPELLDIVDHARTGELVPPGDPTALAESVRRLIGDSVLRLEYGLAAVERVRTTYSWPAVAQAMATAYRQTVERSREIAATSATPPNARRARAENLIGATPLGVRRTPR